MRQNRTPIATASEAMLRQLLEQSQAEKAALAEQLQETQELLRRSMTEPKAEPSRPPRPGYLVITPSPYFDGESMGVRFERGQAFLPEDAPRSPDLARRLADELGYSVLHLDDYAGPYQRPDVSRRPPALPPAPSTRSEAREMFAGYIP